MIVRPRMSTQTMRKIGKSGERRTAGSYRAACARRKERRAVAVALSLALGCAGGQRSAAPVPTHPEEAHREAHATAVERTGGARVIARVGDTAVVALTGASF